jgi:hypothetical protein
MSTLGQVARLNEETASLRRQLERAEQALDAVADGDIHARQFARDVLREIEAERQKARDGK